jgi:hypothetical protein
MKVTTSWIWRTIAISLALTLAMPFGVAGTPQQQASTVQQGGQGQAQPAEPTPNAAPKSQVEEIPDGPSPAPSATAAESQQALAQQESPVQQQTAPREPVGTAAAPYERPIGVPASRPAGAAIAPSKQKRRSSIGIKLGLLIATGVAVGTVVALSSASSSRPH